MTTPRRYTVLETPTRPGDEVTRLLANYRGALTGAHRSFYETL